MDILLNRSVIPYFNCSISNSFHTNTRKNSYTISNINIFSSFNESRMPNIGHISNSSKSHFINDCSSSP